MIRLSDFELESLGANDSKKNCSINGGETKLQCNLVKADLLA